VADPADFWVALDAMGVLYVQHGISALLVRLAASRGVPVSETVAREAYRRASRGLLDVAGLWAALGVAAADAAGLDAEFLAGRALMPGARDFLDGMRAQGIAVGCITNDLAAWSIWSRRVHDLEAAVDPWIVSADVGARKPGREIYEAFVARSGCDPARCLLVDDTPENLDAGRRLGFQTAWFAPAPAGEAAGHRRVGSFGDLTAWVATTRATTSTGGRWERQRQEG
jgi:HAD superfamily hydrolase (TIGR01509 family)